MKGITIAFGLALVAAQFAGAQAIKIERCEPAAIESGDGGTEITLHGRGLEGVSLWSSFPAKIERIDDKAPKFRITTEFSGAGAIRAHSNLGVSDLFFLRSRASHEKVIACEKRVRQEDAQEIPFPAIIAGLSAPFGASYYRFHARGGQVMVIRAQSAGKDFDGVLRLRSADGKQQAFCDDSEIYGADPWLNFTPPADGDYLIELIDSQYRGGLPFRLTIGPPEPRPERALVGESANPHLTSVPSTVFGRFESKGDQDVFRFGVPAGSYLTIIPKVRSLLSPALVRLKISDAEGKQIAATPDDAFDERMMRLRLAKGGDYLLTVGDAFGRYGDEFIYGIELDLGMAPFGLTIPRQGDKNRPLGDHFPAVAGGVIVIPIQCQRHQLDEAITLRIESETQMLAANPMIDAKQGNANLRLRLPESLPAGSLATLRLTGSASVGGKTYESRLSSSDALRQRNPGSEISDEFDGVLAVRVIESPLILEVSPPAEIAKGATGKVHVKLIWRDEKQKFNTTLRIVGAPRGVAVTEKKLNTKDTTTALEVKPGKVDFAEVKDLRLEVTLDFHRQPLIVQSEPFRIRFSELTDDKNK